MMQLDRLVKSYLSHRGEMVGFQRCCPKYRMKNIIRKITYLRQVSCSAGQYDNIAVYTRGCVS
jgi:hypothetical protein